MPDNNAQYRPETIGTLIVEDLRIVLSQLEPSRNTIKWDAPIRSMEDSGLADSLVNGSISPRDAAKALIHKVSR